MLAYWTRDIEREGGKRKPLGACCPTPRASRQCQWPRMLETHLTKHDFPAARSAVRQPIVRVADPWERLPPHTSPQPGKKRKVEGALPPRLEVPEERHQRFFVQHGMAEFKHHLRDT